MSEHNIVLPSKPKVVKEEDFSGVYEIDGFYPGYGHTIGNSLRRIILSSLEGAAIVSVKIDGVGHEFSTIEGVKEDVITILLNLKKVRIRLNTSEPTILKLSIKGPKDVVAGDIEIPGQAEILNPEQLICKVTDKNTSLTMEIEVRKGLGYVSREVLGEDRSDIGTIILDASFTPIRRVNYEVENMRVGNRTDFNRVRLFIETDGTLEPREALEQSIQIMISQLRAIVGFKEEPPLEEIQKQEEALEAERAEAVEERKEEDSKDEDSEFLKTRVESLDLSTRTTNALTEANIRTVGGLVRKREEDILGLPGLGSKGVQEIKRALSNFGVTLK